MKEFMQNFKKKFEGDFPKKLKEFFLEKFEIAKPVLKKHGIRFCVFFIIFPIIFFIGGILSGAGYHFSLSRNFWNAIEWVIILILLERLIKNLTADQKALDSIFHFSDKKKSVKDKIARKVKAEKKKKGLFAKGKGKAAAKNTSNKAGSAAKAAGSRSADGTGADAVSVDADGAGADSVSPDADGEIADAVNVDTSVDAHENSDTAANAKAQAKEQNPDETDVLNTDDEEAENSEEADAAYAEASEDEEEETKPEKRSGKKKKGSSKKRKKLPHITIVINKD